MIINNNQLYFIIILLKEIKIVNKNIVSMQ